MQGSKCPNHDRRRERPSDVFAGPIGSADERIWADHGRTDDEEIGDPGGSGGARAGVPGDGFAEAGPSDVVAPDCERVNRF
jgi:hypothetical protein